MKHTFSLYPGGAAGAGLLMLRLHAALLLADLIFQRSSLAALPIGVLIFGVSLGLYSRIVNRLAVIVLGASLLAVPQISPIQIASQLSGLVALVLLGPGAFSIDARRFGHRVIYLS